MTLHDFIEKIPKVELHVHFQGAIRPETLLTLAERNNIDVPAKNLKEMQDWYTFSDFPHFIDVYGVICDCLQTTDDIEWAMKEFVQGQAEQNIRYTEVTYTPNTRMPFEDQLAALNRGRAWGEEVYGVKVGYVIDIPRGAVTDTQAVMFADWAISGKGKGVVAFGLGGPEVGNPPQDFIDAFDKAIAAGLPSVPHAGETVGPESIWGALKDLKADRIGHGVRCLEDPELVSYLREHQIPLEVNPTSNICLKVFDSMENHPLPRLIEEGLYVTVNSDDPPMFNTTLTNEYKVVADTFGFDRAMIETLVLNALRASFLPDDEKAQMEQAFVASFEQLSRE